VAKVGKERVKKCQYKNQFGVKYFRFYVFLTIDAHRGGGDKRIPSIPKKFHIPYTLSLPKFTKNLMDPPPGF
jgi:hypothetical protein